MKKLLFAGALALTGLFASAQEGLQGKWTIGGTLGYDHDKIGNTDVKSDNFRILPIIGYFIQSDIMVGGQIGYEYSQTKTPGLSKTKTNSFVIMPMARKYFNVGQKTYVFAQLDVPVKFGNTKTGGIKYDFVEWGVNLRPGIDVFLTPKWSVETTIGRFGYGVHNQDGAKHNDNSAFGINLNDINLGIKYVY